jgi:hypothetical protein
MKIEKGDDSAFIEAADWLTPFGGPVKFYKFDESPAPAARNATSVSSSSSSEDEEGSITLSLSSNSSSDFLIYQYLLCFVRIE